MSARRPAHALDEVTQKWRRLAERRLVHFLELHASARWKHYYDEEQFLQRMRETARLSARWAEIAAALADEAAAAQAQMVTHARRRTAA